MWEGKDGLATHGCLFRAPQKNKRLSAAKDRRYLRRRRRAVPAGQPPSPACRVRGLRQLGHSANRCPARGSLLRPLLEAARSLAGLGQMHRAISCLSHCTGATGRLYRPRLGAERARARRASAARARRRLSRARARDGESNKHIANSSVVGGNRRR